MNTLSQKSVFFVVALFSLALLCPSAGSAGIITDDLKTAVDKVLAIMQNPANAAPDKKEERQKPRHRQLQDPTSRLFSVQGKGSGGFAQERTKAHRAASAL